MSSSLFHQYMSKLYQKFQQHDAKQTDRLQRFRNIEPESAQFLAMLVQIQQAKAILEIGTSTGFSTLWLAHAAESTQGQIVTIEIETERSVQAKTYAQELQLDGYIDFLVEDAQCYLSQNTTSFDFILLDAERSQYIHYWEYLKRILRPKGGVLVIDNVVSHAKEVKQILEIIQADEGFDTMQLALGAGLFMVVAK